MDTEITKRDLEALIKSTEKNRAKLQETWRKMENLEAAIQSARLARSTSQTLHEEKKDD